MKNLDPDGRPLNRKIKIGAKASLILLSLYVIMQLVSIYQTRYQLTSPFIPESTIWEINKQFIFIAFVSAIVNLAALILYFFEKYLLVIILIVVTLIATRYIYI